MKTLNSVRVFFLEMVIYWMMRMISSKLRDRCKTDSKSRKSFKNNFGKFTRKKRIRPKFSFTLLQASYLARAVVELSKSGVLFYTTLSKKISVIFQKISHADTP